MNEIAYRIILMVYFFYLHYQRNITNYNKTSFNVFNNLKLTLVSSNILLRHNDLIMI